MAENKKSFVAYCDWENQLDLLSDDEAGKLFRHILAFVNDKDPVFSPDQRILKMAFEPIRLQLKRDLDKYEEVKRKRSEAGRSGGLKSGISRSKTEQDKPNEANASFAQKNEANEAVNVNDTVNVNVTVNDILLEKETKEEKLIKENPDELFSDFESVEPVEEKRKKVAQKKEKVEPPDLETFIAAAREIYQNELKLDFSLYEFAVRAKYNTWIDAGWKDGHKKPIQAWKNKLRNQIPYFKAIYGKPINNNSSSGYSANANSASNQKSGKVSATSAIAKHLAELASGNREGGDFSTDAEIMR